MSNINAICEHGHLARKCEVCIRDGDIAERDARIRELKEIEAELRAEVDAWRQADGYLDLVEEVRVSGKEIDHTTLQLAMAIVDARKAAIEAAKEQP